MKEEFITINKTVLFNIIQNGLLRGEVYNPKSIDYLYGYAKGVRVAINDILAVSNVPGQQQQQLNDKLHTRMNDIVAEQIEKKNDDIYIF